MSESTPDNAVPENGLVSKIETLSVVSNGDQQPLPTSPASSSETKEGNPGDTLAAAERSLLQKVIRKGLVENKNDLEIQRKDPKSPLYSVKSFEALNLKPQLLKGVYSMGKIY
jgi:ATP-dependent RNA helicase DDX19/DBP5